MARPKGSIGAQSKTKYLQKWQEVFDQDPIETLEKIKKDNPAEFMRLGIAAMPKDIDISGNIFGDMDDETLQKFIVDRLGNQK